METETEIENQERARKQVTTAAAVTIVGAFGAVMYWMGRQDGKAALAREFMAEFGKAIVENQK